MVSDPMILFQTADNRKPAVDRHPDIRMIQFHEVNAEFGCLVYASSGCAPAFHGLLRQSFPGNYENYLSRRSDLLAAIGFLRHGVTDHLWFIA